MNYLDFVNNFNIKCSPYFYNNSDCLQSSKTRLQTSWHLILVPNYMSMPQYPGMVIINTSTYFDAPF